MTTRFDGDPEFAPDDPLLVVLRPPADHLGPPPGRYEAIRRAAARRKLLRAAAGAGLTCAVAALVALPLHLSAPAAPARPAVPLAPPPPTAPPASPTSPPASPMPTPSGVRESTTPGPGRVTRGPVGAPGSAPTTAGPSSSQTDVSRIAPSSRASRGAPSPSDATPSALRRQFG
ncbi:hypothetical protein [Streptomyces sp. NPDC102462]|uniref:hypothetical protein n=1 Tax=Streptomyces sp. NPDC102462 TaxID=3366178 RepID=UPI003817D6D4